MLDLLKGIFYTESLFWFCLFLGLGLFLIQFLLSMIGLETHHEGFFFDAWKFMWIFKQGLSGFLMIFGLTGLTCQHQFLLSNRATYGISLVAGIITAWIIKSIYQIAHDLQSRGRVFDISQTIGKEALVYQRISKNNVGKISISIYNVTYEIDAEAKDEIPSFTSVKVIALKNETTVIVKALK